MFLQDLLFEAISFATEAHSGQFRKGTLIPYIVHPMNVVKILINCGCPTEVVIAGILHDTVEDTSATLEILSSKFGKRVADLVEGTSESDRSDSWENRKKETIDFLRTASQDILIIACADKLDNQSTFREQIALQGPSYWENFNSDIERQYWYYSSLSHLFTERLSGSLTLAAEYSKLVESNFKQVFAMISILTLSV